MKYLFLSITLLFAISAGAQAIGEVEAQKTLACHKSYARHAPDTYEVFDKDGLIFARSILSERKDGDLRMNVQLSFTDGQNVYSAKIPSPDIKSKDGRMISSFYYEFHNFRLTIPSATGPKSYCVEYQPRLGYDRLKRYEVSPPSSCSQFQEIKAVKAEGPEAVTQLGHIQTRISDSIYLQTRLAENCLTGKNCAPEKPEEKLIGFSGASCQGLSNSEVAKTLKRFNSYAQTHGRAYEASRTGGPTVGGDSGDGVQ